MLTYVELANAYRDDPREIPTAPVNGIAPKWFYVYEDRGTIYVASGKTHDNVCSICPDRRLKPAEMPVMLELYHSRLKGESIWREAGTQSINASYWFGIFRDLNL